MASLVKKKIGGKAYYYARECKRVDGRPKIVWQKYLGKAEDIVRCMTDAGAPAPSQPQEALIAEFGAVAALYDLVHRHAKVFGCATALEQCRGSTWRGPN